MANTRQSAKRARQANKRQDVNQVVRSATRTALRTAIETIKSKDLKKVEEAYKSAVKTLSKAANRGAIPRGRASRKIGRLTMLIKKTMPNLFQNTKSK